MMLFSPVVEKVYIYIDRVIAQYGASPSKEIGPPWIDKSNKEIDRDT